MIVTKNFSADNQTISANSAAAFSIDISNTGYTPIAVTMGIDNATSSGFGSSNCTAYFQKISGNTFETFIKNTDSNAASIEIVLSVAYVKKN